MRRRGEVLEREAAIRSGARRSKARYPGFFHRRLRPLALSGEQLARGILDPLPSPDTTNRRTTTGRGTATSSRFSVRIRPGLPFWLG